MLNFKKILDSDARTNNFTNVFYRLALLESFALILVSSLRIHFDYMLKLESFTHTFADFAHLIHCPITENIILGVVNA